MGLLLLFVDGVGVGPAGPHNPLSLANAPLLGIHDGNITGDGRIAPLPDGWDGRLLDATLGVDGLPQSGTGQTTILTGVNAPQEIGFHQTTRPGVRLREVIAGHSVLRLARERGARVTFANAFGPAWFARAGPDPPRRASATTLATLAARVPFRSLEDLRAGRAVFHDLTRETMRARGLDAEPVSVGEAASHLAGVAAAHDLTLFEHFLTDLAGHGRIDLDPVALVERLDAFVRKTAAALDPTRDGILVVSDHGNLEDLSVKGHTRYPVPLLTWGRLRGCGGGAPADLTVVAPSLLAALGTHRAG